MTLLIRRLSETTDSIFGQLTGAALVLVTLEKLFNGAPKIPAGTHTLVRHHANHLNREVWMLQDFPDRYFYLHAANFASQLDGCIAVGEEVHGDMISESEKAFEALMGATEGLNEITLVIEDKLLEAQNAVEQRATRPTISATP